MASEMAAGVPQVSIVVPTHNRSRLLERAVRSALAQTATDLEVIVVDDGSNDETGSVVAQFADQRIRYLRHRENRGAAEAWLTGIANATGEFIAFLPDDDVFLPTFLATHIAAFQPGVAVVFSRYRIETERGDLLSTFNAELTERSFLPPFDLLTAASRHRVFLAAAVYLRSALEKLPNEVVSAGTALDYAINVELALRGWSGIFLPVEEFIYTDHPGQTRHNISHERTFRRKHRYLQQVLRDSRLDGVSRRLIRRERSNSCLWWADRLAAEGDCRRAARRVVQSIQADPLNRKAWKRLAHPWALLRTKAL